MFQPRSPREPSHLRVVVDNAGTQASGRVRDMSSSGLFVEADARLAVGQRVAVLQLAGEHDGERLPAVVARVADRGLALRFVKSALPNDAPVFVLTEIDLADENDELRRRVATLEELLRRALIAGWS